MRALFQSLIVVKYKLRRNYMKGFKINPDRKYVNTILNLKKKKKVKQNSAFL